VDGKTGKKERFCSLNDPATLDLSLVVPAYNEEKRIIKMLDEALSYFRSRKKQHPTFSCEVIVANDGSRDKTRDVVMNYAKNNVDIPIKVLNLPQNRGKGAAVTLVGL
jgi:dolichyl-phosphate beta-glucosyltransferase